MNNDENGEFIVLVIVSASSKKWPLSLIAKGKTQTVE
jgi:hypothetical protein